MSETVSLEPLDNDQRRVEVSNDKLTKLRDIEMRLADTKIELAKAKTELAEAYDLLRDTVRQLKVARAGLAAKNEKLAEQAERAEADGVTIDELSRQVDSLWTSHKGMRNEIVSINQRLDRLDEGLVQLLKRGNPRTQPSLN